MSDFPHGVQGLRVIAKRSMLEVLRSQSDRNSNVCRLRIRVGLG